MNFKLITGLLVTSMALTLISCGGEDKDSNQKKVTRKIEVTGSSEIEISPNEIYMAFSLQEYFKNGKKMDLDKIKTDFEAACKKIGVKSDDITVSYYGGNERYNYYWYYRRRNEPDFMGSVSYSVKVNSIDKLDKLVAELNEDALTNFHIEKTSHSDIERFRKEVKRDAVLASKEKATYLAKSVGEEIGETLLIEEVEFENPEYLGYRGYGAQHSNYVALSNGSLSSYDIQGSGDDSPGFKKIKLRYEIKAAYRLK
jgi:uncharacterized protein YggE